MIVATPEDESLTPPVRLETICQDAVSSSYVEYALRPWRKDVDMSRSHIIHAIHALLQDMVGIFFFFLVRNPMWCTVLQMLWAQAKINCLMVLVVFREGATDHRNQARHFDIWCEYRRHLLQCQ